MAAVVVERTLACRASPTKLWPFVTDTERLNRAIGLGRIELSPNDDESAARYLVKTVSGGFPLEYEERPYEWVQPESFGVVRVVRKGIAKILRNTFELTPRADGGTDLTVRIELDPKITFIGPIVRLQVKRFVARLLGEVGAVDRALAEGRQEGYRAASGRVNEVELQQRGEALRRLVASDEVPLAERLIEILRSGADPDVDRMRPFELADGWGFERQNVLRVFLAAVRAGLVELTWDIVCPSCRTASERMRTLSELSAHAHCQLCDISYDLDLDEAVEATFLPAPAIRRVDEGPYCIGGPARTPHVVAQKILAPRATLSLNVPVEAGRYRLFVRGGPAAIVRVSDLGAMGAELVADDEGLTPPQVEIAPGGQLSIRHDSDVERHIKLERVDWARAAATAHHVSLLPEFRRQFAREVLRPGLTLRIARVALLFTDLTGSTELYTRVGDARAFEVVQSHFELLAKVVERHQGGIVKTIGDAVMAAFMTEENAVRAAIDMHRELAAFREQYHEDLRLKIGVHAGACYAITANGVLDYFGQTVNVAARLQGAAGGGEVVMAKGLSDAARERGWLGTDYPSEHFQAELKGLAAPLDAERLRVDASA